MSRNFILLGSILAILFDGLIVINARYTPFSAIHLLLYALVMEGIMLSVLILDKLGYSRITPLALILIGLMFLFRPEEMSYMIASSKGIRYADDTVQGSLIYVRLFGIGMILFTLYLFLPSRRD
jgi:hypothetical protein